MVGIIIKQLIRTCRLLLLHKGSSCHVQATFGMEEDAWNDCLNSFEHLVCGMGSTGLTETWRAATDAVEWPAAGAHELMLQQRGPLKVKSELRQVSDREISLEVVVWVACKQ